MSLSTLTVGFSGPLTGWVDSIRLQKKDIFLTLRDGPHMRDRVAVVIPKVLVAELTICRESYIRVTGSCQPLPPKQHSLRGFELVATAIELLGSSDPSFAALCPVDAGPEVKIAQRHIYLRDQGFALLTRLRGCFCQSLRKTFQKMSCAEIIPPAFVGVECEGGATLFKLSHPGAHKTKDLTVYLTQSSQFYLEYALPGLGGQGAYCLAESFRAESSHTRRHLTEFLHAEAEWKNIFTLEDHLDKLKTLMKYSLTCFQKYSAETLKDYSTLMGKDLVGRLQQLIAMTEDIQVLKHQEAIKLCAEFGIYKDLETQTPFEPLDDIPEAAERALIDRLGKIVFLTHFPMATKSFYMKADPLDPLRAWGVDVEVPGVGEVIGSGVRESDYATLLKQLTAQGLHQEDYEEYLDLRRFGFGQTSGMGMGVDRFLCWILDLFSIREVVTFPRFPGCVRP